MRVKGCHSWTTHISHLGGASHILSQLSQRHTHSHSYSMPGTHTYSLTDPYSSCGVCFANILVSSLHCLIFIPTALSTLLSALCHPPVLQFISVFPHYSLFSHVSLLLIRLSSFTCFPYGRHKRISSESYYVIQMNVNI